MHSSLCTVFVVTVTFVSRAVKVDTAFNTVYNSSIDNTTQQTSCILLRVRTMNNEQCTLLAHRSYDCFVCFCGGGGGSRSTKSQKIRQINAAMKSR